jgi:hypothetical protein
MPQPGLCHMAPVGGLNRGLRPCGIRHNLEMRIAAAEAPDSVSV